MKKMFTPLLPLLLLLISIICSGQSVGIGTTAPNASAQLEISSSTRGLLIPRMDTFAIKAISNPAKGLMVYDSARNQLLVNMGTAAAPNWQNIVVGSGWTLNGNSGTNGAARLGTIDDNPVVLYSNNMPVASLDADEFKENVAIGTGAMTGTVTQFSIGIGYNTLQNAGGTQNIAIGSESMIGNTGFTNICIGPFSMTNNTGTGNIALGSNCLLQNTGDLNMAIGSGALGSNTFGTDNVAVGTLALSKTTGSNFNTAIGHNAGANFDNGYNNVFVGANNDVTGNGFFNVIAVGEGITVTASDQARIGNPSTNSIGGYANWSNFSDGRYKKNIRENVKGLDFIMRLRPITYNLDITGIQNHLANGKTRQIDKFTRQSAHEREIAAFSGFSAQEVEQAATAAGYDFSGIDKPKNANDFYGLRYGDFVVPLVKAVQEQQQMISGLLEQGNRQQQEIAELQQQNKLLMQLLNNKN